MSGRVMDEKEQTGNKKKRSAVLKFSLCVCLYHLAQSPSLEPDLGRAVLCRGGLLEESTNNDVFASAQLTRRPGSLLAAAAAAAKKKRYIHVSTLVFMMERRQRRMSRLPECPALSIKEYSSSYIYAHTHTKSIEIGSIPYI